MRRLMTLSLALLCGLVTSPAWAQPLAVAQPLEIMDVTSPAVEAGDQALSTAEATQLQALEAHPNQRAELLEDVMVVGTAGDGLNAAMKLYQALSILVPEVEVRGEPTPVTVRGAEEVVLTRITLSFEKELDANALRALKDQLASISLTTTL